MTTVAAVTAGAVGSVRGLRALWWVLPPVVLVVLAAGRGDRVGTDTAMYHGFFLVVDPTSLSNSLARIPQESGYVTLMYLVRQWSDDFRVFLAVCSVLTILPVLAAIRRASAMPVLSLFLYITLSYYLFAFNGLRQSVAVSLVLLAETYRHTNRVVWLLLYALAATFHISVLLVLGMILLARSQASRPVRLLLVTTVASGMGAVLFSIPAVAGLLASLNDRYAGYLSTEEGAGIGTVLVLVAHFAIAVLLVTLVKRPGQPLADYIAIYIVSCGVLVLALTNLVAGRFEPYFGIFAVLALPGVLALSRRAHTRGITVIVVVVATVYFMVHTWFYNELVPYESTWNG